MQLNPYYIHVYTIDLLRVREDENRLLTFLSHEEITRADRFLSPIHRQRFIASHGALRVILSQYLNISPGDIRFSISQHKKPALQTPNPLGLQFNLSHSDEIAVCALTLNHAIGIDIEKMKISYNPDTAKRFFNPEEYDALLKLSPEERRPGFYRLWSRKEALIKALGLGLTLPLSSFSVSVHPETEVLLFENRHWTIMPLNIHSDYQSALATDQEVKEITIFAY